MIRPTLRCRILLPLAAAVALAGCGEDGPPEDAMRQAWLAWAERPQVQGFEKVSCKADGEARWFCRFKTRHTRRRGSRRLHMVANRSGYYRHTDGRWSYHGKSGD